MSAEPIQDGETFALQTVDISKTFGVVRAVDELSIAIPRRGMTSVVGPNGSGKSTLVNLLSGVLPLDGGLVIIDGVGLRVVKAHENPCAWHHSDVSGGAALRADQRVGQYHGGSDEARDISGADGTYETELPGEGANYPSKCRIVGEAE